MVQVMQFKIVVQYSGAMWFVPWMFSASLLFCIVIWFAEKLAKRLSCVKYTAIIECVISIILGAVGIVLCYFSHFRFLCGDIALTVLPLMELGRIFRRYEQKISRFLYPALAPILAAGIVLINKIGGRTMDFSSRDLYGGWLYPMILLGILFCLSAAAMIQRSETIKRWIAYFGRYSFSIMALHFLIFNLIDRIAVQIPYFEGTELTFPYTFTVLRPAYIILGLTIPPILYRMYRYAVTKCTSAIVLHNHL